LPANVKDNLRNCNGLMIESNHDLEMLRNGPYPWMVKQRVMSRDGHLSNSALADFLQTDYDGSAEFLVLAHLSGQNNDPIMALMAAEKALKARCSLFDSMPPLTTAQQDQPLQPICVG
jgi:phosphoribosyl 1,2-cyclic phosphodiesterase